MPSQNSNGSTASLGRITKRGDDYLHTPLILGAKSAVMSAGRRSGRISRQLVQSCAAQSLTFDATPRPHAMVRISQSNRFA